MIQEKFLEDDYVEESEGPFLCCYLEMFLCNAMAVQSEKDARVLLYRGQPDIEFQLIPSVFRSNLLHKEHSAHR